MAAAELALLDIDLLAAILPEGWTQAPITPREIAAARTQARRALKESLLYDHHGATCRGRQMVERGEYRDGLVALDAMNAAAPLYAGAKGLGLVPWDGTESLDGCVLLILSTWNGRGDELQWIRFAAEVKARYDVRTVFLSHYPELVPLFRDVGYLDVVTDDVAGFPPSVAAQLHGRPVRFCGMQSLPRLLGVSTAAELAPTSAYLRAPALPVVEQVRALPGLRVGIAWQTSDGTASLAKRSMPLHHLAPLADIPGVSLVSIQGGAAENEPCDFPLWRAGRDGGAPLVDFSVTAAVAAACDLVVTVDTSLAHLAGGLGLPMWVMLPHDPDFPPGHNWRWCAALGAPEDSTPWYPNARLFRQRRRGEWEPVVAMVKRTIGDRCAPAAGAAVRHDTGSACASLMEDGAALLAEMREELARADATSEATALLSDLRGHLFALEDRKPAAARRPSLRETPLDEVRDFADGAPSAWRPTEQEFADVLADVRRSIAWDLGFVSQEYDRGLELLARGCYRDGFRAHEARVLVSPLLRGADRLGFIPWDGAQSLDRRTLMVLSDWMGRGDFLQFIRFAEVVKARYDVRILVVPRFPELAPLLRALPYVDRVEDLRTGIPREALGGRPPRFCGIMSLPHLLGVETAGDLVLRPRYLEAPPHPVAGQVRALPGIRVGLAWSGAQDTPDRATRSMGVERLAMLADVPGVTLVSLQGGEAEDHACPFPLWRPGRDGGHPLRDFAVTAAVADACDLVVTVDTSVAHLAGGLGLPTWVMLEHSPRDWRWEPALGAQADTTPWYPSTRVFRQHTPRDWAGVVDDVRRALAECATLAGGLPAGVAAAPAIWVPHAASGIVAGRRLSSLG